MYSRELDTQLDTSILVRAAPDKVYDALATAEGLDGWFTAGKLIFASGANAGLGVEVKSHRKGATVTLVLWQPMPEPIAADDTFTVKAGCDKRFATCRDRFNNAVNFRGFPHIPRQDTVIRYPNRGDSNAGEVL